MNDVITTAGLASQLSMPVNRRKTVIKEIRAKLRKADSTDDDWDDALDALIEVARDIEE